MRGVVGGKRRGHMGGRDVGEGKEEGREGEKWRGERERSGDKVWEGGWEGRK